MHVHLGFIANAPQVVVDAAADGLALFANTVTPEEYVTAREEAWSRATNVRMGVGMHPWWVADGRVSASDVQLFCELAADAHYIGEIGLDFSDKHTDPASRDTQVAAFTAAAQVCAEDAKVGGIDEPVDHDIWYIEPGKVYSTAAKGKKDSISIGECRIDFSEDSYKLKSHRAKPKVTVSYKGEKLHEGKDYILTLVKNTVPGTGYAVVRGIGKYKDWTSAPFTIE